MGPRQYARTIFDLSAFKWGQGSPTRFLPANFQRATLFHSRLKVRDGTDR